MAGMVLLCALLWWPLDPLVLHALPQARAGTSLWRLLVSLLCLAYLLLPLPRVLRRHPFIPLCLVGLGTSLTMGYTAGMLGGPDTPFFHVTYPMLLFSMVLPLPLVQRAVGTMLMAIGICAGLLLFDPALLLAPFFPVGVSMMVAVYLASVGFGHLILVLSKENFLQALQLQRSGLLLKEHNELLGRRVDEQTHALRRLLADVESAREDERTRISRELHDELGQELSALRYALAFTRQRFSAQPGAIGQNLAELDDLLGKTSATVRHLVADLRPLVLDDLGLGAAVEWLARRMERRTGIACQIEVRGEAEVRDDVSIATFRVLQESLTNVARHAGASRIEVALTIAESALELRVRDDGAGFVVADRDGSGMGLIGMRERIHGLRGELVIESAPQRGTQVIARVPLGQAAA